MGQMVEIPASRDVMVVHLPYSVQDVEKLAEIRDHVLMGINCGVLILARDVTYEMIQVPRDLLTTVWPADSFSELQIPELQIPEAASAAEEPTLLRERDLTRLAEQSDAATKRQVLKRLRDWRAAHGLGCLEEVSSATRTRGRISADVLRRLLVGDEVLDIKDWIKIRWALDQLEQRERGKAAGTEGGGTP